MTRLVVHSDKVNYDMIADLIGLCPFNAIEVKDGKIEITAGCKMCKLCVKKGPEGVFEYVEDALPQVDKSLWNGVMVYIDHIEGKIHPVSLELLGKAKELASQINHQVYALFVGNNIKEKAEELLYYGVDKVFVYDKPELEHFRIEPYTATFENFVETVKPTIILVGATSVGRSLAPRVAARFKTGLTADCTILEVKENTDLVQIRPAFGGNIMAQIITPNHRPQLATVRYKVFSAPEKMETKSGEIVVCDISPEKLASKIKVLELTKKIVEADISDAEVIVVAGRGIKSEKDLQMVNELANLLGAQVASTRPLIEAGWTDAKKQIGLSGRTVKPKLIITLGVSGAVQFTAGMNGSEVIVAVNNDEKAPIFEVAHYALVGDLYEIVPKLIETLIVS